MLQYSIKIGQFWIHGDYKPNNSCSKSAKVLKNRTDEDLKSLNTK